MLDQLKDQSIVGGMTVRGNSQTVGWEGVGVLGRGGGGGGGGYYARSEAISFWLALDMLLV